MGTTAVAHHHRGSRVDGPPVDSALAPVADAIGVAASTLAGRIRAEAAESARAEVAAARRTAARITADARARGVASADVTMARQLAAARREAAQAVLAARLHVYRSLQSQTLDAVADRAAAADGRWIVQRLEELVRQRLGGSVSVRGTGPPGFKVEAESGRRRASLDVADMVDDVLMSMASEIEGLWR